MPGWVIFILVLVFFLFLVIIGYLLAHLTLEGEKQRAKKEFKEWKKKQKQQ